MHGDKQQLARGDTEPVMIPAAHSRGRARLLNAIEVVAFGLACTGGLVWLGACLVAIFRPEHLARPYWPALSGLRTDTAGALAFLVSGIGLAISEYLRLSRDPDTRPRGVPQRQPAASRRAMQAAAETMAAMSAGLVVYLSANQVTHPATLDIQATHFAPWPTEGTLRVLALLATALSTGALRWLRTDRAPSVARERT
jgi:hypothetical protein